MKSLTAPESVRSGITKSLLLLLPSAGVDSRLGHDSARRLEVIGINQRWGEGAAFW